MIKPDSRRLPGGQKAVTKTQGVQHILDGSIGIIGCRCMTLDLLKFCTTDKQRQAIQAINDKGSIRAAASAMGLDKSTVGKIHTLIKQRAALSGHSPEHGFNHSVPAPHIAKGVSNLWKRGEPEPVLSWVKSGISQEAFEKHLQEAADLFYATLPKMDVSNPKPSTKYNKDLIPWFQIGDAHLGMLAHSAEVGHNFDVKIAVTELMTAFSMLFAESEHCERCVINDLGDFTHYENFRGETEQSGHKLDYDGRFPKMIDYYIPLMRSIIENALIKFRYVDIIINQGNHSRTNDIWMARLLREVYSDTDRINVVNNSDVFIPYRMGDTFVMTHHSDKCKPTQLTKVMATDFAEDWGASRFRYIDTGHVHHGFTSKEHPGVLVESWNTLAPSDKYAHEGGWRSRQSITRVDRSRKYGNVARRTLPVEEVQDRIAAGLVKHVKEGYRPPVKRKVYTV